MSRLAWLPATAMALLIAFVLAPAVDRASAATVTLEDGCAYIPYMVVQYPNASGNWFANYDFYRKGEGNWVLDHPVSIIFKSRSQIDVATIYKMLEKEPFGYDSKLDSIAKNGALVVKQHGAMPDENVLTIGLDGGGGIKRRPNPDDIDSFYHIRLYAPLRGDGKRYFWAMDSQGKYAYWVVGVVHTDVNELMRRWFTPSWDKIPDGFPRPIPTRAPDGEQFDYVSYGGATEPRENKLCAQWEKKYGDDHVSPDAANLGNFEVKRFQRQWTSRLVSRNGVSYAISGKYWYSNGRVSVLIVP